MERIHWSKIWQVMEQHLEDGSPKPFDLTFVKVSTGEVRRVSGCTLSSKHGKGTTINVMYPGADRPKKIYKCLILEFNAMGVYL